MNTRSVGGGRFELGRVIGRGAVALVHRGIDRKTGHNVAVKVFDAATGGSAALEKRFEAEAQVLHVLRHPHVVPVIAWGLEPRRWLAMELMARTAEDRVRDEGALAALDASKLTLELLLGLAAVHQRGFVHRDVKPSNLLLTADEVGKLGDFGLARHPRGSVEFDTAVGMAMGSPGFQAPEQQSDAASATAASDVYGVGAVLYWLTTARQPIELHHSPRLPDLVAQAPTWARPLIVRATLLSPEARYRSAADMGRAVALARDELLASAGMPSEARRWAHRFAENEAHRRRRGLKFRQFLKL